MAAVRDAVVGFLEGEGHHANVSVADGAQDLSEIVFRTRGQVFSVTTSELDPQSFSLSTAYEIPDFVHEQSHSLGALGDIEAEYPGTHFTLAHGETIFVATMECETDGVEGFTGHFWQFVGRLRDAGASALERMVDRSESKAAADKFIRQFTQRKP